MTFASDGNAHGVLAGVCRDHITWAQLKWMPFNVCKLFLNAVMKKYKRIEITEAD